MGATPIYGVATVSPNGVKPRDGGKRGSVAAKIRSMDRADAELLPGTNFVRGADEELLASTDLFRCDATLALTEKRGPAFTNTHPLGGTMPAASGNQRSSCIIWPIP